MRNGERKGLGGGGIRPGEAVFVRFSRSRALRKNPLTYTDRIRAGKVRHPLHTELYCREAGCT